MYFSTERKEKELPLVRIDIIGRPHQNPDGTHVAVPLLKDNGNFKLSEQDLNDLILCLKKALKFLNVENINEYQFQEQSSLF